MVQGSLYPATSTEVSTSTLTGTVTGVPGSTLTGVGVLTGTSSFGQTTNYTGIVTIDPSGVLTVTYDNGTISSRARLASASGSTTATPGSYFTQTLSGAMSNTASDGTTPAYGVQTATTPAGWAGATTTSGLSFPYYAVSLTGGQTSGWSFRYLGQS